MSLAEEHTLTAPYPGLRPFTAEEALFFKGREKHIQQIKDDILLQKFLMITGASGDGKSSLVYAGLLPMLHAGMVRGPLGRWKVAVMKPGASPMDALCQSLCKHFNSSAEELKEHLKFGYAALCDLYLKSDLYINTQDSAFLQLDEKEQKNKIKKGSNLFIVVDQFEEFFTLDSNFNKESGQPENEALLVMNILLETIRISQQKGLPIYIAATMRSDFIGNAPAYRGLPEMIGNHQYFVPRLTREELSKVITEPAELNGQKISERLVQRLINDLDVINTDVLPSLQHALRQIWELAGQGKIEMDLIHYCMAGGMKADELPREEKQQFQRWLNGEKSLLKTLIEQNHQGGISNILNLHAEFLFLSATYHEDPIKKEKNEKIIQHFFKCLTQITENRPVRNRMALNQIAEICDAGVEEVNALILPFRKQGTTLIFPFLNTVENEYLKEDTWMDITHEALIRNWQRLLEWAKKEHELAADFHELKNSMQRWLHQERKKEGLLTEGAYTYYQNRFDQKAPKASWIERYLHQSIYITDGRSIKDINIEENEFTSKQVSQYLQEYFTASQKNIVLKKKIKKANLILLSSFTLIAVIAYLYTAYLKTIITQTAKANEIATMAYSILPNDPVMALRLAEESYKIRPTQLNEQIIYSSYGQFPFYTRLSGHTDHVSSAGFSHNGKLIFTSSDDKTTRLWDNNGKLLHILKGHREGLSFMIQNTKFSPSDRYLLTGSKDSTVRIWDTSGVCLKTFRHDGEITAFQLNQKENVLITVAKDKVLKLWSSNGDLKRTIMLPEFAFDCQWMNHEKNILSATRHGVYLWDTNGVAIHQFTYPKAEKIVRFVFSKSGDSLILKNDLNGAIDILNGDLVKKGNLHIPNKTIVQALYSPDGKNILVCTTDEDLAMFTKDLELLWKTKTYFGHIWGINFSPVEKEFFITTDAGTIHFFDYSGREKPMVLKHNSQIFMGEYNRNGTQFISCSNDETARIWNLHPHKRTVMADHKGQIQMIKTGNQSHYLASAAFDQTCILLDQNGKLLKRFHLDKYSVRNVCFSPDDKILASSTGQGSIYLFDVVSQTEIIKINAHKTSIHHPLYFNQNGKYILSVGLDQQLKIHDTKGKIQYQQASTQSFKIVENDQLLIQFGDTCLQIAKLIEKDSCSIQIKQTLAIGSNLLDYQMSSQKLMVLSEDSCLHIYSPNTVLGKWEKVNTIKFSALPKNLHFLPFSDNILISFSDFSIKQFDGKGNLTQHYLGHNQEINQVLIAPNGKYFATCSNDQTMRIWNFEGKQIGCVANNNGGVNSIAISLDSKHIFMGTDVGIIKNIPVKIEDIIHAINIEKERGEIHQLSKEDLNVFGINKK